MSPWTLPSSYQEFSARHPKYIRQFVQRQIVDPEIRKRAEKQAVAYLSSAPKTRDYADRFEMLICDNPDATETEFFSWLAFCLSWIVQSESAN